MLCLPCGLCRLRASLPQHNWQPRMCLYVFASQVGSSLESWLLCPAWLGARTARLQLLACLGITLQAKPPLLH